MWIADVQSCMLLRYDYITSTPNVFIGLQIFR